MWASEKKENGAMKGSKKVSIRCRTLTPLLGTSPADEQIYTQFIASQAPDAMTIAQELETKAVSEVVDKGVTVFPTARFFKYEKEGTTQFADMQLQGIPEGMTEADGEIVELPYIHDYQWKGGFKEALAMLSRAGDETAGSKIKSYKKVVDGNWFVFPRRIPMIVPDTYEDEHGVVRSSYVDAEGKDCKRGDPGARLRRLERPLRTSGPTGERVALAVSEVIPAGTEFFFQVVLMKPEHLKALTECMDYKNIHGMLQWRNSGMGRIDWTPADELGRPIDDFPDDKKASKKKDEEK